jgi:Domain of unknown function (DUF6321)
MKINQIIIKEGEVIPMKSRNPLNKNLIIQLKSLSKTALELFWEGSNVPTAVQGQMAQLSRDEQTRLFNRVNQQMASLGYEYSMNEEDSDSLKLHSIAREAWYDSEKPMSQFRGLPDLEYNSENNTLHVIDLIGDDDEGIVYDKNVYEQDMDEGENWSKYNHKRVGGMSKKSVSSYRRSHPGSKIQTAVTTKPSKLKKGSKSAKRRASFCARMRGMKKHRTGAKTARDPNSNINKSLRRWHCESIEDLQQLVMLAEQKISKLKEAGSPAQQAAIAINMKKHHKKPKSEGVAEESCPHCSGPMFSEMMINEKKDACYYKVKSRYSVWPSAYASGALVKCRNKGAKNWGNGGKKNESIEENLNQLEESLHDWFSKEKWVRMDTKGNIKGPCAREPGEGKPKCLPQSKAHNLGKKGRASAAQRKRREDPNPDRHGAAINVNTKKKQNENIDESWSEKYKRSIDCSHPKGFSQKAHCAGKKKHNESIDDILEMTCPDCGMCETHGNHSKDKLDELKCWSGYHRVAGTKAGFPGSCAKNKTNEESMDEGNENEQSKYLQGAKDIVKGADPHHIARVRNLDPDTLQRYVKLVWDKLDSKEYNYRKPDLAEVKDDEDDGLIGGRYTPEQWAKMIANLKRKAQEQDAKKKQQEKPKDLGESTVELNNILKLSGHNK